MKEARFFYVPKASSMCELPADEASHALRVLRLQPDDEVFLIDGKGVFYKAIITLTSGKHCYYEIVEQQPQSRCWHGKIHLAMAPTKMMERVEWMAEKATEIGFDELSFLDCRFSERRIVKTERVERIVVAAVKQSRKPWKPIINPIMRFDDFIQTPRTGVRCIAHCYDEIMRSDFFETIRNTAPDDCQDITILIGPEGDFSVEEVQKAVDCGFIPVSLGTSRLRTETACLSAVMMSQLARRI